MNDECKTVGKDPPSPAYPFGAETRTLFYPLSFKVAEKKT